MKIQTKELREGERPEKTQLYRIAASCCFPVEEHQQDGSVDRVMINYRNQRDDIGYFAKEYRPTGVEKTGAKVIDITAIMINSATRYIRWYLYDVKDTLAGEGTVLKLCAQWNAGLKHLARGILSELSFDRQHPSLGVITRNYDRTRMERLRDKYEQRYNESIAGQGKLDLARRKRVSQEITKSKGILTAAQYILEEEFQSADGERFAIDIRYLALQEKDVYSMDFLIEMG